MASAPVPQGRVFHCPQAIENTGNFFGIYELAAEKTGNSNRIYELANPETKNKSTEAEQVIPNVITIPKMSQPAALRADNTKLGSGCISLAIPGLIFVAGLAQPVQRVAGLNQPFA